MNRHVDRWILGLLVVGAASRSASAQILGDAWFPIGPAPIEGFFPGGVTGRASAIAVNPMNPADVWLGTAAGGVWHSIDGGQHWTPMADREAALAIGALALADCTPTGCGTVFAGTGENAIRRDTYHGAGLLVGGDGGEIVGFVWSLQDGSPTYNFRPGSINDIEIDPTTSGTTLRLFISLSSGVTVSATEATVTAPEPSPGGYGLYRSNDRGATWTKLTVAGTAPGDRPTDLEMDPADPQTLYAGFLGKGVFRSTDGGTTWCPLNSGIPRPPGCPSSSGLPDPSATAFDHVEIALFPGDSNVVYAELGHCADRLIQNCIPSIYRSTSGGDAWSQRLAGSPNAGSLGCPSVYSRYTHDLVVHPASQDTLFLAGIHLCKSTDGAQTFLSSDANTQLGTSSWGRIIHLDHHEIFIDPASPNRMYSTSDGGFAFSTDAGTTWTPGNADLQITGFHSIASSPLTGRVIGASQDNSGELWRGARTWSLLPCCGDGGFSVMDLDDPMKMYIGSNFGTPTRSVTGGASWSLITNGLDPSESEAFYAPIVQDPSPPHPLYHGKTKLYRSANDGDLWTPVSPVFSTLSQPEIIGGVDVITAVAVAPSDPARIYAGTNSGRIFVTSGACTSAACWPETSTGLPAAPVTRIAVHPTLPDTAYATFSGFGTGPHVFKTDNAGGSWAPAVTGLPSGIPANTIAIETSSPETLWLGLDSGSEGRSLFKSKDGGATWAPFANGLPNAPVFEISIDETHGRVYAATHGRGAFVLGQPFLSNFEGWVNGGIWDIPVYGNNFLPHPSCELRILRQDGTTCASGTVDVMGGSIFTNAAGELVTSRGGFWSGKPVAWACFNGRCLGGVNISACNSPSNPITTVVANCGGELGIDHILGCPLIANPPSTLVGLSGLEGESLTVTAGDTTRLHLTPSVQSGDGSTRALCTVGLDVGVGETDEAVLGRAAQAINANRNCAAATVTAHLDTQDGASEDEFPRAPRLFLQTTAVQGGQLMTSLHRAAGAAAASCLSVQGLGVPVVNQIQIPRLRFGTLPGGAAGGAIRLIERTDLGTCALVVPTFASQTPEQIAQAVGDAFEAPGIPGPHPDCPADRNARDVTVHGDSVVSVAAIDWLVCVDDPAVSFTLRPEELANVHPVADAGEDLTIECTGPQGTSLTLDGTGSSDADSSPGTQDDIVLYEWFENFGSAGQVLLGTGGTLAVTLAGGSHVITLRVTDAAGLQDLDELLVAIADTLPPTISVAVRPTLLWPPNHKLRRVHANVQSSDVCGPVTIALASAVSSEPDDAPRGDGHTRNDIQDASIGAPDYDVLLRAERQASGPGRTYTLTYTSTDASGNRVSASGVATVPRARPRDDGPE